MLDGHYRITPRDVLARSAVDRAQIDQRVVVKSSLHHSERAVILAHNGPSGVAVPSADDVALTARVREALEMFGVQLLEHVVVGEAAATIVQAGWVTKS